MVSIGTGSSDFKGFKIGILYLTSITDSFVGTIGLGTSTSNMSIIAADISSAAWDHQNITKFGDISSSTGMYYLNVVRGTGSCTSLTFKYALALV